MAKDVSLTVTVSDDSFTAFVKKFNELIVQMEKLNDNWKKVSQSIENAAKSGQKFNTTINILAVTSRGIHSSISQTTKHFYKWGALVAGIGTLLGGGGLFGMGRFSEGVVARQRYMAGAGLDSYGGTLAAQTFGKSLFDNPNVIMDAVKKGRNDPSTMESIGLRSLGLFGRKDLTNEQVSEEVLRRITRYLHDQGYTDKSENLALFARPRGLEALAGGMDNVRRAAALGSEQSFDTLADRQKYYREHGPTPEDLAAWDKLWASVKDFGMKISSEWTAKMAPIAGALAKVSDALGDLVVALFEMPVVQRAISKLAGWMNDFATYLEKDETKKALEEFINKIAAFVGPVASGIGTGAGLIWNAEQWIQNHIGNPYSNIWNTGKWLWNNIGPSPAQGAPLGPNASPPGDTNTNITTTNPSVSPFNAPGGGTPWAPAPVMPGGSAPGGSMTPGGIPIHPPVSGDSYLWPSYINQGNTSISSTAGGTLFRRFSNVPRSRLPSRPFRSGRSLPSTGESPADQQQKQGGLDLNNWQSTRTASLVVRGVPSSNLFLQANGMG